MYVVTIAGNYKLEIFHPELDRYSLVIGKLASYPMEGI